MQKSQQCVLLNVQESSSLFTVIRSLHTIEIYKVVRNIPSM